MRLLLDTHVLLWWSTDEKLEPRARAAIASPDNEVAVSVATLWEAEIKLHAGKLKLAEDVYGAVHEHGFDELPISRDHALTGARLPQHHSDPFDRVLMGQALVEGMVLVTRDSMFERYDVPLLKA
jgi:PIN domain nuclease of toxin-antitoxin system